MPAGADRGQRVLHNRRQVVRGGEVHRDTVTNHRVQAFVRESGRFVRPRDVQLAVGQDKVWVRRDHIPDVVDGVRGEVRADVPLAQLRDPKQYHPVSAAELERAPRPEPGDALADGLHPLTDNLRAVHAPGGVRVPVAAEVEAGVGLVQGVSRRVRLVVHGAPRLRLGEVFGEIGIVRCISTIPVGLGGAVRSVVGGGFHHVRDELPCVFLPGSLRRVVHRDHRLLHSRELLERGLNLSQLDPVAADLHLVVQPPEALELERVRSKPAQVAGAVQPRGGIVGERVAREPFGGESVAADVPTRHARAADTNLPDDAHGRRLDANLSLVVHLDGRHVDGRVGDRSTDGGRVRATDGGARAPDRRLRRAVDVKRDARGVDHVDGELRRDSLAADKCRDAAERRRVRSVGRRLAGARANQRSPRGRSGLHEVDVLPRDEVRECARVGGGFPRRENRPTPDAKRQEELQAGNVEADGGDRA
mmetsp:Transcript_12862/g.58049  ORF Transcript_12862/g.58049 Transcript_12862/m.58049 type:complete len:476 (+) Transcript_12862:4211-5638(+)